MILARKKYFRDEFAKITYTLSYMKDGLAGIWVQNFTKAQNTANNQGEYTWKKTVGKTSICNKITKDFKEFNKQADARDKLVRLNQGKESFNAYFQIFKQVIELSGVEKETKKTHFLRGLNWELVERIYTDPAMDDEQSELVKKARRYKNMCIKRNQAHNL